jgi:hypothetical protein
MHSSREKVKNKKEEKKPGQPESIFWTGLEPFFTGLFFTWAF